MEEVIIREAVREDAEGIAWVRIRTWQTAYTGLLPEEGLKNLDEDYERMVEVWRQRVGEPESSLEMFVAVEGDEVVGIAGGGRERSGEGLFAGELYLIYILESYQKQGIGRRLMSAVAMALLKRGIRSMVVWVFQDSPYRAFYEALGGVYVGEQDREIWGEFYKLAGYGWENLEALILDE
jgi:GNAT superfamily N-acetyltransferase